MYPSKENQFMGILSLLSNPEKKRNADIDLAEALLAAKVPSVQPASTGSKMDKQIVKILKKCPTRQSVLDKVIELCGVPETSRQRYISAVAHTRSRADNKEKAIESLELYLANPPCEEAYRNARHFRGSKAFFPEEEKKQHLAEMYSYLGKAYEVGHSFRQALASYSKELELTPFDPASYCRISSIHVKRNQLTSAMNVLANAKKTSYYKPIKYKTQSGETVTEDTFKKMIDTHILDLEKKIEKGYVYSPKKK